MFRAVLLRRFIGGSGRAGWPTWAVPRSVRQNSSSTVARTSADAEFVKEVRPQPVWRMLGFAVAFTGGAFVTAAVIETYERQVHPERDRWRRLQAALRSLGVETRSPLSPRATLNVFWTRINQGRFVDAFREQWAVFSPSHKTLIALIAINTAVFVAWRIPRLQPMLTRYFLHTPSSPAPSLLLNMFSHIGFLHFAFNMFALWSFGRLVHDAMGREQFLALYTSAGVVSSFLSHVMRRRGTYSSLGASGALYALLACTAVLRPDARIGLVFLPYSVEIGSALPVVLMVETVLALAWRRAPLDHVAHVSGALAGYAYMLAGKPALWDQRDRWLRWRPPA